MMEPHPYYAGHFLDVINALETLYGHWLSEEEKEYVTLLRHMSRQSLCLYVRLVNRKGRYFRLSRLCYSEVEPISEALLKLYEAGLLQACSTDALDSTIWDCFTHPELRELFGPFRGNKSSYCEWVEQNHTDWQKILLTSDHVISRSSDDPWDFLKFLYFGRLTDNLSGFVVREMGYVVLDNAPLERLCPQFVSREEAHSLYELSCLYNTFRYVRESCSGSELLQWWQLHKPAHLFSSPACEKMYGRLVAKIGRILEREGHETEAMALYDTVSISPCRERLTRLLIKSGDKTKAVELCEKILAAPCDSEEAYIAAQLRNRLISKQSSAARLQLNAASCITVAPVHASIELNALHHFQASGWQGAHMENWPWNALFGLLLWDIIYDPAYGCFHQPLQMIPSDMHDAMFYERRKAAIEERLNLLDDSAACSTFIAMRYHEKEGFSNPFIGWQEDTLPMAQKLVEYIPGHVLAHVMRHMAQDAHYRKGFPDLFLWRGSEYRLIEIKSLNDQLSAQQLHWQHFFAHHQVHASVLRVIAR